MAIEIVDLPIENGGSFHSYVSLALDPLDQIGAIGADCSKVPVQVNSGAARREGEGGALFFRCKRAGCPTNGVQKSIMSIM